MASVSFLLASIHHQAVNGLLSIAEARKYRQDVLSGLAPFEHPLVKTAPAAIEPQLGSLEAPKARPLQDDKLDPAQRRAWAATRKERREEMTEMLEREHELVEWDNTPTDCFGYDESGMFHPWALGTQHEPSPEQEPWHMPVLTAHVDLDDCIIGLLPDDLVVPNAEETETDWWLHHERRRMEVSHEKRRQRDGDLTHVTGANYKGGAQGSKDWLDDQLAQMRLNYAAVRKGAFEHKSRCECSMAYPPPGAVAPGPKGSPEYKRWVQDEWIVRKRPCRQAPANDVQLGWLPRRAELMRARYNVRRHLEALGVDPSEVNVKLAQAEAWERDLRSLVEQQNYKALLDNRDENYITPDSLIPAKPSSTPSRGVMLRVPERKRRYTPELVRWIAAQRRKKADALHRKRVGDLMRGVAA